MAKELVTSFVALNAEKVCTSGSQCVGFTLDGSYTTNTDESGASWLTVKTELTVPDEKWLSEEYASFFGIEMGPTPAYGETEAAAVNL